MGGHIIMMEHIGLLVTEHRVMMEHIIYILAGPVQIAHLCYLYSVENLLESKLHNCATSTAWRTF